MLAYASHIPKFACGDPKCDAQYCPVCFSRHSHSHQHPGRFFNQIVFNVPPVVAKSPAVIQKAEQPGAATAASATPDADAVAEQAKKSTGWKNVLKPADINHAAKWTVETAINSTTGANVKMPKVDYVGLYKWGKKKANPALAKRMGSIGQAATPAVGNQAAVLDAAAQSAHTQAVARPPASPHPAAAVQPTRQPARQHARPAQPAAARPNNAGNSGYGNNSQDQDPNNYNAANAQYQDPSSAYGGNTQYQNPNSAYGGNAQYDSSAYGNNAQYQSNNVNPALGYNTQYQDNSNPAYGNNTQYNAYGNNNQYQGNNTTGYGGNMYYQDNSNSGGLDASDALLASAMVAPDASTYTDPSAPTSTGPNSPPLASPNSFWSDPTGAGTPPDPTDTVDPYAMAFDPSADATSQSGSLTDPYASMEMGVDPEAASMTGGSDQQSYTQTTTYEQTTTTYDDGSETATYESTTFDSTTAASDNDVDDTGYDS